MSSSRNKSKAKPAARPKAAAKAAHKPAAKPAGKPKPAPVKPPVKPAVKAAVKAVKPKEAEKPKPVAVAPRPGAAPAGPLPLAAPRTRPPKKSSRRSALLQRRGPDGQILAPGELLLPGGATSSEEIQYLFRGVIATQKATSEVAVNEVVAKKQPTDPLANRGDLERLHAALAQRFHQGSIEGTLPNRGLVKRTFAGVIERAKQRRREIGAFLRGLDVGRPESSQMDSHGEASLQSLMEWSARIEKLAEDAREPAQGDYTKFHRFLDQLDHTTEGLIVDVELTLRRLGSGRAK